MNKDAKGIEIKKGDTLITMATLDKNPETKPRKVVGVVVDFTESDRSEGLLSCPGISGLVEFKSAESQIIIRKDGSDPE